MKAAIICLLVLAIALMIGCDKGSETSRTLPAAASPDITPTNNPTPNVVQVNFAKHCVSCHGASGEAGIVKANNKTLQVPSLRKGHALDHTDEQLAQQIAEGDDEMPAFKDKLSGDEINALVRYIRQEFQGK